MRLLVLGGTEFVGRAVVEGALGRGWDVTVFHRGRHAPPHGVAALHGDRTAEGGLKALADPDLAPWDAVVDTWSGAPRAVRDSARLLADRAERYVYVSSGSVYTFPAAPGGGEDRPVVEGSADDGDAADYARAKRGGELAATAAFGDRALLVRAGLILGPWENIGRLPWWLTRVARGGEVLAPGPPGLELQYIDVRDLAAWTLDAVEAGLHGPYGLVSPPGHTTMRELLETLVRVTGSGAVLGGSGRSRTRRGRTLDGAAGLGAAGRRAVRHPAPQRRDEGTRVRAALPPVRRDGGRYVGVAARGRRRGAPAAGQATSGARAGARGRAAANARGVRGGRREGRGGRGVRRRGGRPVDPEGSAAVSRRRCPARRRP